MKKKNVYCFNCQSLMVYVKRDYLEEQGLKTYDCLECGETIAQYKNSIDDTEEKTKDEEDKNIT